MNSTIVTLICITFWQVLGIALLNVIVPYWTLVLFNWLVEQVT